MNGLHFSILFLAAVVNNTHAVPSVDLGDRQEFDSEKALLSSSHTYNANNGDLDNGDLWTNVAVDEQPALSLAEKEKRTRDALLRITANKNNRRTVTQFLPILRSLSQAQKAALAAIVSVQANQRNGNELSHEQVERLFGEKRAIILPILLDIANVVRNVSIDRRQQPQHQINERKYETIKHRHRRTIDFAKSRQQKQSGDANGENKSRHRKSVDYYSLYSDIVSHPNATSIELLNGNEAIDDYEAKLEDNLVHVTLPLLMNRSRTLDEYEDLAFDDLDGTEYADSDSGNYNESLPQPAMLLSNRFRIPIRRQPPYLNMRKCELFGNLCLRVGDYPTSQIMRSINRHKNAMSALLAEHPTPVREYFDQKRNILLTNSMTMSKRREDDEQTEEITNSEGGAGGGGMCPSVVRYARPQKARSATGEWKYIVNTAQHTQTLRLEKCSSPENACNYLQGSFKSRCIQIYNYHRLLSWDNARGLHVDIFKVPTCCSCHIDSIREQLTSSNTKYSTIFADDDDDYDEDESEEQEDDSDTRGSIAYQYSNGFKKTPKVAKVAMPTAAPPTRSSILTMKKFQTVMETAKKPKPSTDSALGSYLKPPQGIEFDGDGSYKKRFRRPMRTSVRDQIAIGSELHPDISPITIVDFFDRPFKRRTSVLGPSDTGKSVIPSVPSISTAATSAYDLGKRVNYNYHPIIDFFGETVSSQ